MRIFKDIILGFVLYNIFFNHNFNDHPFNFVHVLKDSNFENNLNIALYNISNTIPL